MMGPEPMQQSSLQFPCQNALTASSEHQKVKGEVFDKVVHLVA